MNMTAEMHKRVASIKERYDSLTNEELLAMRKGMQETYVSSLSYATGSEGEETQRSMDALTAIATLLYERAERE